MPTTSSIKSDSTESGSTSASDPQRQNYRFVRIGFQLMFYGIIVYILYGVLFAVIVASAMVLPIDIPPWLSTWAGFMAGSVLGICLVASCLGPFVCIGCPERAERVLNLLFHGSYLAALVFGIWNTWLSEYTPAAFRNLPLIPLLIGQVFSIAQLWFFLKYCQRIAKNAKCKVFLKRAMNCQFYATVVFVFILLPGAVAIMWSLISGNENPVSSLVIGYLPMLGIFAAGFCLFLLANILIMLKSAINEIDGSWNINLVDFGKKVAVAGGLLGTAMAIFCNIIR